MIVRRIDDNTITIEIDESLFPEQVVFKCFYWYGANYTIDISRAANTFEVQLTSQVGNISDERLEQLTTKIRTDLLDYKTRQIIHNETNNIKQILIVKAFSASDEFDESPQGEINDPVVLRSTND